jgi:hypothetical protein
MGKITSALVAAALAFGALAGYTATVVTQTASGTHVTPVSCPTEDSCDADYHDGAWHIYRTVP